MSNYNGYLLGDGLQSVKEKVFDGKRITDR